jgi:hypothetical protein
MQGCGDAQLTPIADAAPAATGTISGLPLLVSDSSDLRHGAKQAVSQLGQLSSRAAEGAAGERGRLTHA